MARTGSPWIVLKFGGTSVSTLANWRNIARVAKDRRATGARVLIVHSALSGITDRLEKLLETALRGEHQDTMAFIEERHRKLCAELGIEVSPELQRHFTELAQVAAGLTLIGELSDRTRARVMSKGELMATELGARYLRSQGLDVEWADARTMMKAEERRGASNKASILNAACSFSPEADLDRRLSTLAPIVVTQGFIASDEDNDTVLLGRGG